MSVRLTQLSKKGGCAAKVQATVLREILSAVQFPPRLPEVLIDGRYFDDAAIVRIDDTLSLVHTLDFFTPVVDSPYTFGQIAAANALSDVYAMGGAPKTALAILAFPVASMEQDIVAEVLRGACERLSMAGTSLVGGHSIDDETLKFGLSVTGTVSTANYWSNANAQIGDALILTKPLGTGTLTAALKRGQLSEDEIADAIASMIRLNHLTLPPEVRTQIHAATDITGFGLAGHGIQLGRASQVTLRIDIDRVPRFTNAISSLAAGNITRAHTTNREYTAEELALVGLSSEEELLCFDPQTSGGLLLSVSPVAVSAILEQVEGAVEIGRVVSQQKSLRMIVERGDLSQSDAHP